MRRNWMRVLALLMALCVFFSSTALAENIAGLLAEDDKQEATIAEETPVSTREAPSEAQTADSGSSTQTPGIESTPIPEDATAPTLTGASAQETGGEAEVAEMAAASAQEIGGETGEVAAAETASARESEVDAGEAEETEAASSEASSETSSEASSEECKHDGTLIYGQERRDCTYEDIDADGHTACFYADGVNVCSKCGATVSVQQATKRTQEREEHVFSGDTCTLCQYTIPCAHANAQTSVFYRDARYEDTGAAGHNYIYYEDVYLDCPDCGALVLQEAGTELVTKFEPHTLASDVCTGCGYTVSCTHESVARENILVSIDYNAIGDAKAHDVVRVLNYYCRCQDCGETWIDEAMESFSEREAHEFKDGACSLCGYVVECAHENVRIEEATRDVTCTPAGAEVHITSYYRILYNVCDDCGERWLKEEATEPTTVQEAHYFKDGACIACEYENTCAHENMTVWMSGRGYTYTILDPERHSVSYYAETYDKCADCGERWLKEVSTELTTEWEAHSFKNGVCSYCEYENTCAHENLILSPGPRDWTYTASGAEGHIASYYVDQYNYCPDCDSTWLKEAATEPTTALEAHCFVDGICELCSYENACAHENRTETEYCRDWTYTPTGAEGHIASYYADLYDECPDCGEKWLKTEATQPTTELYGHYFVNGVCDTCGYENACAHENRMEVESRRDWTYTPSGAEGHIVSYYADFYDECPDCGERWLKFEATQPTTTPEAHSFADGVCELCGSENTCTHENTETSVRNRDYWIDGIDADGHNNNYYQDIYLVCQDCGEYMLQETGTEVVTERERHYLEDNVCVSCGYVVSCEHGNVTREPILVSVAYASNGDARMHDALYVWNYFCKCEDCNGVWVDEANEEVTEQEPHCFESGICTYCGYENACTHANLTEVTYYRDWTYTPSGAEGHIASYYSDLYDECPDCGEKWLKTEATQPTMELYGHYFVNGVCDTCGYENACAHENRTEQGSTRDWTYTPSGAEGHITSYYVDIYDVCPDCGERWLKLEATEPTTELYGHYFVNGVCDTCGYENTCAHENRTEQESTRDWTYTPSGAEGHITSYYTDIYDVCPDCGESWLKTEATQPTTELNRHGFVDGVCNACGYVNTCTHANQNSGTFMIVESYGDPTASGHSMFGYRVYYYSCPDCGEYREEREEELSSEFVSHSFNSNSICLQCNWECEHAYIDSGYCQYCYKACEHSYDTYEATSSRTQHYAICSTCGNRTMQDHSFEEGICTLCGFDCHLSDGCLNAHLVSCRDYTVCLRSGSMVEDELMTVHHGPDTENRFEETHGYDGYMHWSICQGCSEEIEIDAHSFDENGCCTGCSLEVYADGCHGVHVVGCAAPNVCLCTGEAVQAGEIVDVHHGATSDSDYDWTGSYRITPQRHYWIETCAGCGGERLGDFCSHTLRCTDRTCVSCGYVAPELQGAIEHEYADYQSNATLHWQVCTLCGEATERFPHSGSNGVCNVCGEEFVAQQCNHEVWCGENVCWYCGETVTLDDTVRIRHESDCVVLDDERHAQKCWNCGILYDIDCHGNPDDWMGNEVTHINDEGHGFVCACGIYWFAPHVFVDGCCFECNYVPGDGERHVYDNIYGPTYVDDEGHWKYCEYCGEKVWEAHSFYRGVCKGCDYRLNACAHENRYAMYDIYHWEDRSNYQPVNERYHMLTGTPVLDIWCYDCDALISASEWPTERRLEPHGFKNGVCYWCGYEQAQCAHSETETIPHYDYESYEVEWRLIGSDAQGHHYVADYIEDEVCVRCGEVLSSTKNGTIERLEPHRVSDADATQCLCGDIYDEDGNWIEDCVWPITCAHEHTEIVEKREESIRYASGMDGAMYMGAFFPLDENSHELHMDLEYAEVCQDCGLEIRRSDLTKLDEVVTLPHNFYRGICLNCGYHKLAITKQPESVKVAEGALANVKVTASGEGLKYAWWIAAAGSTSFSKSSVTAASYSVAMNASRAGRQLYCVVTDAYGNSVKSNTVKIDMIPTLAITKQPESVKVAEGALAKVQVEASGEGLKYAWWYAPAGSTKFSKSSVTAAGYSVAMNATRAGRQLYCVITDAYGNSVTSNTVTIEMIPTLAITKQPESVRVAEGALAKVQVEASGEGLKYAWWIAAAGSTSFSKSSVTAASYSVAMNASRAGRQLYCVVTDAYGNSVTSNTVTIDMIPTLAITKQPESVKVAEGALANVKVEASGEGLKYAWWIAAAGSTKFSKSSVTAASYSVAMNASRAGRQLYCVVTDAYGNSVKSNTVTIDMIPTLAITKQPENVKVAEGALANVKVEASGEGLKYAWWYAPAGSTKFSKSSVTAASYSVAMNATRAGRQLYCVITDAYGNSVTSNTVTIDMIPTLAITKQPESVKVAEGALANVKVEASGEGLKYAWWYAPAGSTKFSKSSVTAASYSVAMNATRAGRQLYCVVTDAYGNSVTSNTVTIDMIPTLAITKQPESVKVAEGALANVKVEASGEGLKYAWWIAAAGSTSFSKSSVTAASYSVAMNASRAGRQLYCVVTDAYGNSVKSNTVTIDML